MPAQISTASFLPFFGRVFARVFLSVAAQGMDRVHAPSVSSGGLSFPTVAPKGGLFLSCFLCPLVKPSRKAPFHNVAFCHLSHPEAKLSWLRFGLPMWLREGFHSEISGVTADTRIGVGMLFKWTPLDERSSKSRLQNPHLPMNLEFRKHLKIAGRREVEL